MNKKQPKKRTRRPGTQRTSQSRTKKHARRPAARRTNQRHPQPKRSTRSKGGKKLRISVIGGAEEVGRNMTMIEYGDDIIIIDLGLQFPEEDMPGIDYIIPNTSSFKNKKKNIRGVIITHGHMDHIGAIPHVMDQLGNPTVYCSPFTSFLIKKRQEEYKNAPTLKIRTVSLTDTVKLGGFRVEFLHLNHTIPENRGVVIHTPEGTVVHSSDWKFDLTPIGEPPADFAKLARLGSQGVLALLSDSTNAYQEGRQISEREVAKALKEVIERAPGRVIIGTFASLLSRVRIIIELAEILGRKVVIEGYSMKTNVEIAKEYGYLKAKPGTIIDISQVDKYPKDKVIIMGTGAQGQSRAMLMRIAHRDHRYVQIEKGDTVVFSSSVIPGNERTVQRLQDTLVRQGAKLYKTDMMDIHAGGHAKKEDIKLMLRLIRPKYYVPIEGNHYFLRANADVAQAIGYDEDRLLVADNGQIMEFAQGQGKLTSERLNTDYVFVDGLGVGDVSDVVLRDRQQMADEGMIVVIASIEGNTGKLVGNPDIISRGFIYMKENKQFVEEIRARVKKIMIDKDPKSPSFDAHIKNKIRDDLGQMVFKKTQRRPMILPVVNEV